MEEERKQTLPQAAQALKEANTLALDALQETIKNSAVLYSPQEAAIQSAQVSVLTIIACELHNINKALDLLVKEK